MKKHWLSWYLPLALFVLFACCIQTHGLLNDDVINGMYLAKLRLAGGNYVKDFFENNPPLIMYLYMPPMLFSKLTSVGIQLSMDAYIALLAALSLLFSHHLLTKIFVKESFFNYVISYTAVFVLLFLPGEQFAQREHLVLIFALPYIFLAILRLENKSIKFIPAVLIGIFAGIGFAIKPYFMTVFILIELFLIFSRRNLFAWIRAESIAVLCILVGYAAWVWFAFPAYVQVIAPLALQFYYIGNKEPWHIIFRYPGVLFGFSAVIFYFIMRKDDRYSIVSQVLFLALLGFIASYIVPRNAWGYHTLPAVGMAFFVYTFLFSQMIFREIYQKQSCTVFSKVKSSVVLITMASVVFVIPVSASVVRTLQSIELKNTLNEMPLIAFFNKQPKGQTFTCLSLGSQTYQPLAEYSNVAFVGSFSNLWWEIGYHKLLKQAAGSVVQKQLQDQRKQLVDAMATDLAIKKPHFILVDITPSTVNFALVNELLEYTIFHDVWKQYRYVDTFTVRFINPGVYQLFERT